MHEIRLVFSPTPTATEITLLNFHLAQGPHQQSRVPRQPMPSLISSLQHPGQATKLWGKRINIPVCTSRMSTIRKDPFGSVPVPERYPRGAGRVQVYPEVTVAG